MKISKLSRVSEMQVSYIELGRKELDHYWDQVLDVYRQAFGEPPYERGEIHVLDFSGSLTRHRARDSFKFAAARLDDGDELVGIAYGYTCLPGQWWFDVVSRRAPAQITDHWLRGAFELVEFAVYPAYQGQGIGGRLHDFVLQGLPHRRAVLSTMQVETPAYRLYINRGWQTLIEPFVFPGVIKPYRIMGIELKRTDQQSVTSGH